MRFFKLRRFITQWTNYEYWPWLFFYLPAIPVHLWYALRSGYMFYNTAVNPGIDKGGLFGESKIDILNNFSDDYKPKTYNHKAENSVIETLEILKNRNFEIPIIIKPNVGERGLMVVKANSFEDIETILKSNSVDYIIQEFIDYPHEFGVLYARIPDCEHGKVLSITLKGFLTVTGDGNRTIEELLLENKRAWFQIDRLRNEKPEILKTILAKDKKYVVEHIGNHCRGTEFINGNYLITENLHKVFDQIAKQFDGFYLGRFDLKAKSFEEFQKGQTIKIFELNGVTSEPGHIYDKNHSLMKAYRDIFNVMAEAYKISRINIKNGVKPFSTKFVVNLLLQHFKNK